MAFLTVDIDGTTIDAQKGSFSIELRIEERSTASLVIVDTAGTSTYYKGQPVTIDDATGRIFGGVIDTPEQVVMAPDGGLWHFISCADWHYLADKRLIAESYTATAAGTIVEDIRTKYLAAEGVTAGTIEAGPDIVEAIFNYVRATDAFDALAEKAGKVWFIDQNKALHFKDRTTTAASWALDDTTNRPTKGSTKLSGANPKYRNRQYIRGGRDTTAQQTETFTGDGATVAFTVGYPFERVPTVTVGGAGQTIGIKGIDTAKQCYWNKGDATITFAAAPGAVAVVIVYYGQYDILVLAEDTVEIAAQLAIEGAGTGYNDDISDEPTLNDKDASIDSAKAKLAKYGIAGKRFKYRTTKNGLMPGQLQTITQAAYSLTAESMLIESVAVSAIGSHITYDIVAIQGPASGSWASYFQALASMKQEVIERLNVGTEQILIILVQRAEILEIAESFTVTVYTCDLVDTGLVDTAIVC